MHRTSWNCGRNVNMCVQEAGERERVREEMEVREE